MLAGMPQPALAKLVGQVRFPLKFIRAKATPPVTYPTMRD